MAGQFSVTEGQKLDILVGNIGWESGGGDEFGGGGGGGTFIVDQATCE